jgi:hypothetical protein
MVDATRCSAWRSEAVVLTECCRSAARSPCDAVQRPQVAGKSVCRSASKQRVLDLTELRGRQLAAPADRAADAQPLSAAGHARYQRWALCRETQAAGRPQPRSGPGRTARRRPAGGAPRRAVAGEATVLGWDAACRAHGPILLPHPTPSPHNAGLVGAPTFTAASGKRGCCGSTICRCGALASSYCHLTRADG